MKVASFGLTVVALATAWTAAATRDSRTPTSDERTQRLVGQVYRLTSMEGAGSCRVTKDGASMQGLVKVNIDPVCEDLFAGLGRARYWRDRADGAVELAGVGGETLVAFANGDGAGYEFFFQPRNPLLRLAADR